MFVDFSGILKIHFLNTKYSGHFLGKRYNNWASFLFQHLVTLLMSDVTQTRLALKDATASCFSSLRLVCSHYVSQESDYNLHLTVEFLQRDRTFSNSVSTQYAASNVNRCVHLPQMNHLKFARTISFVKSYDRYTVSTHVLAARGQLSMNQSCMYFELQKQSEAYLDRYKGLIFSRQSISPSYKLQCSCNTKTMQTVHDEQKTIF